MAASTFTWLMLNCSTGSSNAFASFTRMNAIFSNTTLASMYIAGSAGSTDSSFFTSTTSSLTSSSSFVILSFTSSLTLSFTFSLTSSVAAGSRLVMAFSTSLASRMPRRITMSTACTRARTFFSCSVSDTSTRSVKG